MQTKQILQEVLLHCFNLKRNASEAHRLPFKAYPEYAKAVRVCQTCFDLFITDGFDVEDNERLGQVKKFEDEELEPQLDEDTCQTRKELLHSLNFDQATISRRLKDIRI